MLFNSLKSLIFGVKKETLEIIEGRYVSSEDIENKVFEACFITIYEKEDFTLQDFNNLITQVEDNKCIFQYKDEIKEITTSENFIDWSIMTSDEMTSDGYPRALFIFVKEKIENAEEVFSKRIFLANNSDFYFTVTSTVEYKHILENDN